jgi:hypothetical protein
MPVTAKPATRRSENPQSTIRNQDTPLESSKKKRGAPPPKIPPASGLQPPDYLHCNSIPGIYL